VSVAQPSSHSFPNTSSSPHASSACAIVIRKNSAPLVPVGAGVAESGSQISKPAEPDDANACGTACRVRSISFWSATSNAFGR
jgi:hypothetical protein